MRVFVAGATGVVGRRAVPALLARGHAVTAVARTAELRAALEKLGATPIGLDLLDPAAVERAVAGHDAVVNLATHIPRTGRMFLPGAWRENDRLRREASSNLEAAARAAGAARLVQESFALVHADRGDRWVDEASPVSLARYDRSVLDAERAAERFARSGASGVVLRFAAFYGPDSSQLAAAVAVVRHGWAAVPGAPDAFLSSVSHDDAAAAVVAALGLPSGVYEVADDEPLRRREWFDVLARAVGARAPRFLPAWTARLAGSLGETLARSLRISNEKLRGASGWAPRYPSAREGLPAAVAGMRLRGIAPSAAHATR